MDQPMKTTHSLVSFLLIVITIYHCSNPAVILCSSLPTIDHHPDHHLDSIKIQINASSESLHPTRKLPKFPPLNCIKTENPIDNCWRCDPNWNSNRRLLANCSKGFGKNAIGGLHGRIYVVVNSKDDDPVNPIPGTLRHAVLDNNPRWIIFARDMTIHLKAELIINSHKTIDGRGVHATIGDGKSPCILIKKVSNVIIHGVHIHNCKKREKSMWMMVKPNEFETRKEADGDGISIISSRDIWIDHCTLSNCADGLIDAIHGSTRITISNNLMFNHDKVMLLGDDDKSPEDKFMEVTIALNHFGDGLVQRMPRCRFGKFHVVNNLYSHWLNYAIGGSAAPTILSESNIFIAGNDNKEVTHREDTAEAVWKHWNWKSKGDVMRNNAIFISSGSDQWSVYKKVQSMNPRPSSEVARITASAGVLNCVVGKPC